MPRDDQKLDDRAAAAMGPRSRIPNASKLGVTKPPVARLHRWWGFHTLHRTVQDITTADCPSKQAAQLGEHIAAVGKLLVRHAVEYGHHVSAAGLRNWRVAQDGVQVQAQRSIDEGTPAITFA